MKPAICTQCGAPIEVDETKEAGICPCCGTAFITEKAINNYVTNTVHNINNNVTKIIMGHEKDEGRDFYERGLTFLKLRDFSSAQNAFLQAAKLSPEKAEYWFLVFYAETEGFVRGVRSMETFDKFLFLTNAEEKDCLYKEYGFSYDSIRRTDEEKEKISDREAVLLYSFKKDWDNVINEAKRSRLRVDSFIDALYFKCLKDCNVPAIKRMFELINESEMIFVCWAFSQYRRKEDGTSAEEEEKVFYQSLFDRLSKEEQDKLPNVICGLKNRASWYVLEVNDVTPFLKDNIFTFDCDYIGVLSIKDKRPFEKLVIKTRLDRLDIEHKIPVIAIDFEAGRHSCGDIKTDEMCNGIFNGASQMISFKGNFTYEEYFLFHGQEAILQEKLQKLTLILCLSKKPADEKSLRITERYCGEYPREDKETYHDFGYIFENKIVYPKTQQRWILQKFNENLRKQFGEEIRSGKITGYIEDDKLNKIKPNEIHWLYRKSGCYIATCVYGSYDCPEVWTLRRYRDNSLKGNFFGRGFIKVYYAISPKIVRLFGKTKWFNNLFKKILDKKVKKLKDKGYEDTPYCD